MIDANLAVVLAAAIGAGGVILGTLLSTVSSAIADLIGARRARNENEREDRRGALREIVTVINAEAHAITAAELASEPERSARYLDAHSRLAMHLSPKDHAFLSFVMSCMSAARMDQATAAAGSALAEIYVPLWERGKLGPAELKKLQTGLDAVISVATSASNKGSAT